MAKYSNQDDYLDSEAGILKNKLGIELHPFRDGNGRVQREFINQLSRRNGYFIDWKNISQKEMLEASIQSFKKNLAPLVALIRKNLN